MFVNFNLFVGKRMCVFGIVIFCHSTNLKYQYIVKYEILIK